MLVFVRIYSDFFLRLFSTYDDDFAKKYGTLGEGVELETLIGLKSIHLSRRELPLTISFQFSND